MASGGGVYHPNHRWYQDTVFYELPIKSFSDSNGDGIGDFPGATEKLDYLQELGVGALWLLPFYPSPWRDDGYDVTDHYGVHPAYGTFDDLDRFIRGAHAREIYVVGDLVSNHVSDQHPWFQEARKDPRSPRRDWFVWSDTDTGFSRTRVIFKDTESSNWTWDPVAGQFYFHRFFAEQPDLNYDNPAVRAEILNVARFWLRRGLDGFRCDAVPYLFKREGTLSQSLPEVHRFFQEMRAMIDAEFPERVLIAEANQTIPETMPYFNAGHEFQLVLHFPLMPSIFVALARSEPRWIGDVLRATLPVPEGCAWAYFLRNHDELSLEMASDHEREAVDAWYAPEPSMRLNEGIRRRLAPLVRGDRATNVMLHALLLSLPGSAFLYYGDEIGMGDNVSLPDRGGVRTPMQWTAGANAGFSTAPVSRLYAPLVSLPGYDPASCNVADQMRHRDSLLARVRRLLAVRRETAALRGTGSFRAADGAAPTVLAYWRESPTERVLCAFNLGADPAQAEVEIPGRRAERVRDLVLQIDLPPVAGGRIQLDLPAHGYAWVGFGASPTVPSDSGHPLDAPLVPPASSGSE